MKFIINFFYVIGVLFTGGTLHELVHFFNCGGEFVSGLAYLNGNWWVGATWCKGLNSGGEIIPTTLEVLFYVVFIWGKIKYK